MVTANLNTSLIVGQTGNTLTCGVSGAENLNLMIVYQWTRYNGTTSEPVGNNTNTLSLSPLRLSDAGNYSCSITSTLLNNPISATNSQSVMIQSNCDIILLLRISLLVYNFVPTVPDPKSAMVTSSSGTMILSNGSGVTLTCSVQMNQNVLTSELPLLMVTAQLIGPDGSVVDLSDPIISGTTYNFTTQVNFFSDNDVGN